MKQEAFQHFDAELGAFIELSSRKSAISAMVCIFEEKAKLISGFLNLPEKAKLLVSRKLSVC